MLASFARLPFSFDPLMAEAKRRARQRRVLIALAAVLVGLAVSLTFAFWSPGGGSPTSGGLSSGHHLNSQIGGSGQLAVTAGMTAKEVLDSAGKPLRIVKSNPRNPDCWAYPLGDISGKRAWVSTYGEHVAVCFKHGRVDYVGP